MNGGGITGTANPGVYAGETAGTLVMHQDALEFLELAPTIPVETAVEMHSLVGANLALGRLRSGMIRGSAVLLVDGS